MANAISRTDFYDFLIDIVEESCKNKLMMCANINLDPSNNIQYIPNVYQQPFNQGYYYHQPTEYFDNRVVNEDIKSEVDNGNIGGNSKLSLVANNCPVNKK